MEIIIEWIQVKIHTPIFNRYTAPMNKNNSPNTQWFDMILGILSFAIISPMALLISLLDEHIILSNDFIIIV